MALARKAPHLLALNPDIAVVQEWNLGVMVQDGRWVHFEMDLGNDEHREAFWRGEVPAGVKLI